MMLCLGLAHLELVGPWWLNSWDVSPCTSFQDTLSARRAWRVVLKEWRVDCWQPKSKTYLRNVRHKSGLSLGILWILIELPNPPLSCNQAIEKSTHCWQVECWVQHLRKRTTTLRRMRSSLMLLVLLALLLNSDKEYHEKSKPRKQYTGKKNACEDNWRSILLFPSVINFRNGL